MDGESVTDLILRAVAAMRERDELPAIDAPQITVLRVPDSMGETFHANVGQALAVAQVSAPPRLSAQALASAVAEYLRDVIDLVPAYHNIAAVASTDDGTLIITLRSAETR
jgi:hypothetical protein